MINFEDNWVKKKKGNAKIYTNSYIKNAIVENFLGVHFNGKIYKTVDEAKEFAYYSLLYDN